MYWKRNLITIWLCHLSVDFFTGIWPAFKTIAHLDLSKAGLIIGICGFLGDGSQLFFGALADRALRKKLAFVGLLLAGFASFLPLFSSYISLFLLMLVVYIGSGIFHPAAAGIVQNLIPSRKSFAITVFASGGALGLSLSQLIFSQIYMSQPSLTSVLFFLPIFALVFLQNSKNYPENLSPKRPFDARNLIRPFTSGKNKKAFSFLYFSQLCQQAVVYGFIFFLPDILRLQGHSPLVCLGLGHCMLIIGSGFMLIPFGLLADFFGQKAVLLFLSFLNTILFYLFIFKGSQSGYLVNLLLFSLGATLGSFNPIGVSFGNRLVANKTSSVSAILMGGVWCFSHIIGSGLGGFLSRFFIENAAIGAMSLLGFLLPLSFIFVSLIPSKKLLDIEGTNDIPVSAGNANEVKG